MSSHFNKPINVAFSLKDLEDLNYFLGVKVTKIAEGLHLTKEVHSRSSKESKNRSSKWITNSYGQWLTSFLQTRESYYNSSGT